MRFVRPLLMVCAVGLLAQSLWAQDEDGARPPLSHVRAGGTPYDPNQIPYPYSISAPIQNEMPTSGLIASPPEYSPVRGVLMAYVNGQWPTVVRDLVVALTKPAEYDEIAYVVVISQAMKTSATNAFVAGGADMSKVQFIIDPLNALWIRDYGPHFIWQDGALAIVDSHYYPERPADNFIPTEVGDDFFMIPTYDIGLYYSGGNFQPGPGRIAVMSSLINVNNPASEGFNSTLIAELFNKYQGIDTLHIFPQLPPEVDGTGHIDMWMYLVNENTCIISQFQPGSNPTAIQITNDAVGYMQNLGFTVYRTPAWVAGGTHYTYTNAFRVNNRIFVPIYGPGNSSYNDDDAAALATWQAAAGADVTLVSINSYNIIPAAGAIHCIVMQVPRYTDPDPAAHVVWPDGGQLLISGTTQTISWAATDTDNVTIPQIDLYYTLDGGATYSFIATTTNTGFYSWTVPPAITSQAKIKVVATGVDGGQGEAVSANFFQIAPGVQTVYDYKTGGGVDKNGYGYQTLSWSSINGVRKPVTTPIPASAYTSLANSDNIRYATSIPGVSYECTVVYEFTIAENPAQIDDIGLLWEGYGDGCSQVELYIWDYVRANWSDLAGQIAQNRYINSWAGNRDGYLTGHIRSSFEHYVDANGQLTLLIYDHRNGYRTFHDYLSITVTEIRLVGDMNCDDALNAFDIDPFVLAITDSAAYAQQYPDCDITRADVNQDGVVNASDIEPFVALLVGG